MYRLAGITLAAALITTGAHAVELFPGATLGTTVDGITAALQEDGYTVVKFEREHGRIEVKAVKDRILKEIKIDPQTGTVMWVEDDD